MTNKSRNQTEINDTFYKNLIEKVPYQKDLIEISLNDGDKDYSKNSLDNDMEKSENVLEDRGKDYSENKESS